MARRRALVRTGGDFEELPASDTLGANVFFTGSAALPTLTLLVLAGTSVITVTPRIAGDVLAAGECITVTPAAALPAGLNVAYALVTAPNQVTIGFSAAAAIAGTPMAWTVCAHR